VKVWCDPNDEDSAWAKSVVEMDYEVLVVSQFTLHANLKKGNKPDFHCAMSSVPAREAFDACVDMYKQFYRPDKIQTGSFGSMMKVSLENDGPVTFCLEVTPSP
jgi:D-tyrosyl-tRNA(Tyr) deacylase